ncbi:MAG: hypothetical protein KGS72_25965 [Cyanobacteria bacterium REEB67]|nr:hypothetical protein [Cyanobacteria bacterium REEB67]
MQETFLKLFSTNKEQSQMEKEITSGDKRLQSTPQSSNLLSTKMLADRWPEIFAPERQCRMRASGIKNLKGDALKWYFIGGRYYVNEADVVAWLEGCAINSTAELPAGAQGDSHKHIREARAKRRKSGITQPSVEKEAS